MRPVISEMESRLLEFRPLGLVRIIELLIGAVLPTVFVVPFLVTVVVLGIVYSRYAGLGVLISLIGIGAVYSMWMVILFGPEQVKRDLGLRRFVLLTGIPGLLLCCYMLWYFVMNLKSSEWGFFTRPISLNWRTIVRADEGRLVFLGLAGPFLVGLRYLPALFGKGGKG